MNELRCPTCGALVDFVAQMGAPGIGSVYECRGPVKHHLVKMGANTLIDTDAIPTDEEPPWILSPEDVI